MPIVRPMFREIYAYRELLFALTYRDIRVKYKQAVFGVLWAFLTPILSIAAGIIFQAALAFMRAQPLQMEHVGSVMVRSVPWALFVGILSASANGLLGGMALASKIYFPREIIPLSSTLGVLFDFTISGAAVLLLLVLVPTSPLVCSWSLLLLPVLLLFLVLLSLGLGLIFGAANLFFRDVKYILNVIIQFGVFFTPVFLFLDQMPRAMGKVIIWNPVAPVLEAMACIVTRGSLASWLWPHLAFSALCAVLALAAGLLVFRKTEYLFAEVL